MGITAAMVIMGTATVYSADQSRKSRKDAKDNMDRIEKRASESQAEQEALANEEKKVADTKLEEQRSKILKGKQGRRSLLFGDELGVTDKNKTLG